MKDGEDIVILPSGDQWEIRVDRWWGVDEEDRCPAVERFRYAMAFRTFDSVQEAEVWLDGYETGARENM